MALLTIDENPTISDQIVFKLETPDLNGCFLTNPFKVDKVIIYYVERSFSSGNFGEYNELIQNKTKDNLAKQAEILVCANPTEENITNAKKLRKEADSVAFSSSFYFNDAVPVYIIGNESYPAWLSTDLDNSFLELKTEDENGNTIYGHFEYTWEPKGVREGDYFICWTWTHLSEGDSFSSHSKFYIKGNSQLTTSIPTHFTDPDKYITLLDRYTPEMFKLSISSNDKTSDVINKFNKSVASGFNVLEDLTNQLVDLQDANSISENLLPYLSNLFDLKLKTDDPTRWRGQIKRAIPLFKCKGTKKSLQEAMEHAAINLNKITLLWEITSSYTWQECFTYENDYNFELEKTIILPIDYDNFELWIREEDSDEWIALSSDYVNFTNIDGVTNMLWVGGSLSIEPIGLNENDEIKILYKYQEIDNFTVQTIENYIRSLPLLDQRDKRNQDYPLKNWNVRVIEESDPMFDLVIPTRSPYMDPLIYGKVRTEFPYSENIYNMEEYNGSIRNSKLPCDIDKDFISPCSACISSAYNVDLEIENLSDDRIQEAKEVLIENSPFHAVLHTLYFTGGVSEFIQPPVEEIEALITINGEEFVLAGNAQTWFNRVMKLVETNGILRDELANKTTAMSSVSCVAYNDEIVLFCPESKLDNIGMSLDGDAKLNILSPSSLSGVYDINNPNGNSVVIDLSSGGSEPIVENNNFWATNSTINSSAFVFDINNNVASGNLCNIEQSTHTTISDVDHNFGLLGVKSQFDVDQGNASAAWKILYNSVNYNILDINPDGSLTLDKTSSESVSVISDVTYSLMNGMTVVLSSDNGKLTTINTGIVTVLNSSMLPIQNIIKSNDKFFFKYNSTEYLINKFVLGSDDQFYIFNYSHGDVNGVNLNIIQKIISKAIGYLSHNGLKLKISGNLESTLGIQNGTNSLVVADEGVENNGFKENFIIRINSENYFISEIDGTNPFGYTTINLSGNGHYWKTLNSGGTNVVADIYQYEKLGATIQGQQFDLPAHTFPVLDRSGHDVISRVDQDDEITTLSVPDNDSQVNDYVYQTESIGYTIQYTDGTTEQGQI